MLYKIIATVLANRLSKWLDNCIDKAQSAFVLERLISDNVLVAYKLLLTFNQKQRGRKGLMALKLDMSKTYDSMNRCF